MDQNHNGEALLPGIRDVFLGEVRCETRRLVICLLSTFLIGLAAHAWGLMHLTVNQDSLSEFYWSVGWKFFLGRYAAPAVRYAMGEIMVLPWLTGLSALLFLSLTSYLICRIFSLDRVWEHVVLSGIFVANGALTTLVATYVHDFAGDMLALLMAVCMVFQWARMKDRFSWKPSLIGGMCLFVCISIYQAYLAAAATLICIYGIAQLLSGEKAKEIILHFVRAIPMVILALAAYGACVLFAQNVLHYDLGGNGGNDITKIGANFLHMGELVCKVYKQTMRDLFVSHWSSVKAVFGLTTDLICFINIALAAVSGLILTALFVKEKMRHPEILLTLGLILLLPLCMCCVSIASGVFHYLLRYAVYLYYLLVLVLLRLGWKRFGGAGWQQLTAAGLIGLVVLSNVQVSNTAYQKKDLEAKATLSTMTRVLARLEEYEGYEFGESEVAFAGVVSSHRVRARVGEVDGFLGMGPTSQIADENLEKAYLNIFLNYPVNVCSPEKEQQIMETEQFRAMGSFPARDCIATIDGVVVVKLSDADFDYTQ